MGPLPPPAMLVQYNDAVPNAAERIIAMAERQSAHREELEKQVIKANIRSQTMGSIFGFIIGMTAILSGAYLIRIGKDAMGLASIIGSLVALVGVFIVGKIKERKELRQKSEALEPRLHSR